MVLAAVGNHLERSQILLIELMSADPKDSVDLSSEREQAREDERDAQMARVAEALLHPELPASLPLLPNLTALTPIVRQAYRDADGVVHLGRGPVETGMQTMRHAILAQTEVVFCKIANRCTALIGDSYKDVY